MMMILRGLRGKMRYKGEGSRLYYAVELGRTYYAGELSNYCARTAIERRAINNPSRKITRGHKFTFHSSFCP